MSTERQWYSPEEFANMVGVSKSTVHNWIKENRLPVKRFGSQTVRIHKSAVEPPENEGCTEHEPNNAVA